MSPDGELPTVEVPDADADVDVAALLDALRRAGQTVATAESITGGGVCTALTGVAGSSDVVRGGHGPRRGRRAQRARDVVVGAPG